MLFYCDTPWDFNIIFSMEQPFNINCNMDNVRGDVLRPTSLRTEYDCTKQYCLAKVVGNR